MRWAGHVARLEEKRNAYRRGFFGRKRKATISLERPRRRWEGSVKMDLEEIDSKILYWMYIVPVTDHFGLVDETSGTFKRRGSVLKTLCTVSCTRSFCLTGAINLQVCVPTAVNMERDFGWRNPEASWTLWQ
jgi:hypothetical protein